MTTDATTAHVPTLVDTVLAEARESRAGRAGRTLTPGAGLPLTQTLLAMVEGVTLNEHESPGAATLHVLQGRLRLNAAGEDLELGAGDHASIPAVRHSVTSLEDAVALLTVAAAPSA
jgi:quercetin dioxygenase-like cupin family protein